MRMFRGYTSQSTRAILSDKPSLEGKDRTGDADDLSCGQLAWQDAWLASARKEREKPRHSIVRPLFSARVLLAALAVNAALVLGFAKLCDLDAAPLPKPVFWIELASFPTPAISESGNGLPTQELAGREAPRQENVQRHVPRGEETQRNATMGEEPAQAASQALRRPTQQPDTTDQGPSPSPGGITAPEDGHIGEDAPAQEPPAAAQSVSP